MYLNIIVRIDKYLKLDKLKYFIIHNLKLHVNNLYLRFDCAIFIILFVCMKTIFISLVVIYFQWFVSKKKMH